MNDGPMTPDRADWLRAVVEQYEAPLLGYAHRMVGNLDGARDIVQDTFLRLCRQPPVGPGEGVKAWYFRVCRNRALDVLPKEQRMKSLTVEVASQSFSRVTDQETHAVRQEEGAQDHDVLKGLPPNQQEVIRLKIEHGLSYRE